MERDAYDGEVIDLVTKVEEVKVTEAVPDNKSEEDHIIHRPPTRGGGRNMQESSFAFSGMLNKHTATPIVCVYIQIMYYHVTLSLTCHGKACCCLDLYIVWEQIEFISISKPRYFILMLWQTNCQQLKFNVLLAIAHTLRIASYYIVYITYS